MKKFMIIAVLLTAILFLYQYKKALKDYNNLKEYIRNDKAWGGRVAELAIEKGRSFEEELSIATKKPLDDGSWFTIFLLLGLI